ncbi:hypothetical protein FHS19_000043 [Paenibacillus rhizosphaerae]|uniref:Uncharacterized protein n=1 Tax=Paenibacillus rhizosphaerae TaxID=297318 RepID=A0A839TJ70_9BACL|nr:hypothetical protein [Paenibacillus rhizosphaerae]
MASTKSSSSYDFDDNGKGEVVVKTQDGIKDAKAI